MPNFCYLTLVLEIFILLILDRKKDNSLEIMSNGQRSLKYG